jgi:Arc/MetJ-type ribon-helix-helix transcriptional regulator
MRTISMKLPDDLLSQLEDLARTRRVSKSQVVRESLERALREDSTPGAASCYELARDLAGALRGLPKDLADNPKYMDGFGQ